MPEENYIGEYNYPYTPPEFLQGQSADEIHSRMLDNLPKGIDKSEGNIPWDYTRPSALDKAQFVEFTLNEQSSSYFPSGHMGNGLTATGNW